MKHNETVFQHQLPSTRNLPPPHTHTLLQYTTTISHTYAHSSNPRSLDIMNEPVTLSDGFTYDRAAIAKWTNAGNMTSPITNGTLSHTLFFPNQALKNMIRAWREEGVEAELVHEFHFQCPIK